MLKKTKVKLDLLTNINIRGIRGEIYHAIYWYVEIDNKYMKNNVTNKELSYLKYWDVNNYRVIAWPYLMTLYVIFTINVNFPITSRFVLRATIQKKKKNGESFYVTWKSFFSKRRFYDFIHACCFWLIFRFYHNLFLFFIFLYLSFINHFRHITFYTRSSSSIFLGDFPFSSFPVIKYLGELIVF